MRADDPAGFALKVLSLGLLGVTVGEEPEQTRDGLWSLRTASGKTTVLQTIDAPAWRWCTNCVVDAMWKTTWCIYLSLSCPWSAASSRG